MASILVSLHSAPRGCEPVDTPGQMLSSFLWPCYPSLSPHFLSSLTRAQSSKSNLTQAHKTVGPHSLLICVDFCLPQVVRPASQEPLSHPILWPRSSWVCLFCPLVKGSRCRLSSSSAQQVAVPFTWSLSSELSCFSMHLGRQLRWDLLQRAQDSVSGDLSHAQLCH